MKRDRAFVTLVSLLIVASSVYAATIPENAGPSSRNSGAFEGRSAEGALPIEEAGGRDEGDELRLQQQWFYRQRAYPARTIEPGSLGRANAEARAIARATSANRLPRAPSATLAWSSIGPRPINTTTAPAPFDGPAPYAGRVTAIAHHPTKAAVAYLGAANGGVWKTTNSGTQWSPVFDFQPSLSIGAVAVDPRAPSTIYAGTGEANNSADSYFGAGLFRSTNAGGSWSKIGGNVFNDCHIGNVVVSPTTSSTLFVVAGGWQGRYSTSCATGIYRSLDGGATWRRVLPDFVTDLVLKSGTPKTLYAGVYGTGVWTSTTNGSAGSWSKLAGGLPTASIGRVAVATTPDNPSRLYAAIGNTNNGKALGLWTSTTGGSTWTELPYRDFCAYTDNAQRGQCDYDLAIGAYPADENFVYVGGIRMTRFDGTSWTTMGYNSTDGLHVDIHAVNFDASNRLWVGSDGGAYLKSGTAAGFTNLNATLGITQIYPGTSGRPGGTFLAGTQDNGNLERRAGSWNQYITGDGGYTAYDSANRWKFGGYVYAELYRTTSTGNRTCLFTTDALSQTSCNTYADDPAEFIAPMIMSPSSASTLFIGTDRVWKTTNSGDSWNAVSPHFAGTISAIAQSKSNADVLYGAWTGTSVTGTFVGRTTNAGANWFATAALPDRVITDIQVKASAPNVAWVTLSGYDSGHVFLTQDSGDTWTDISSNLPNAPVNRIAVDVRTSPSRLFVATDVGVFWSTDGGASWGDTSSGLPNTVVTDIRVDAGTNTLIAATYGRGAFTAPIPAI